MIQKLTQLLIKLRVAWFPKKLAERLYDNDVVIVTRCHNCEWCKEIDAPQGTVYYCSVHEGATSPNGYCHNSTKEWHNA